MDSLPRDPKTHTALSKWSATWFLMLHEIPLGKKFPTYNDQPNPNQYHIDNGKYHHSRRRHPLTLVDVQPEHATQAVTEPRCEEGSLKKKKKETQVRIPREN